MEDYYISFTIVLSVISALLTSLCLFLIGLFVKRILIPWYQNITYQGINISGEWYCSVFRMAQDIHFNLDQNASKISGIATYVRRRGDDENRFEDLRTFSIQGFIQDRFAYLTLKHQNNQRLGIVVYLLEAIGDGRELKGKSVFYSIKGYQISALDHVLWRDKNLAEKYYQQQEHDHLQSYQQSLLPDEDEDTDNDDQEIIEDRIECKS